MHLPPVLSASALCTPTWSWFLALHELDVLLFCSMVEKRASALALAATSPSAVGRGSRGVRGKRELRGDGSGLSASPGPEGSITVRSRRSEMGGLNGCMQIVRVPVRTCLSKFPFPPGEASQLRLREEARKYGTGECTRAQLSRAHCKYGRLKQPGSSHRSPCKRHTGSSRAPWKHPSFSAIPRRRKKDRTLIQDTKQGMLGFSFFYIRSNSSGLAVNSRTLSCATSSPVLCCDWQNAV